MKNEAKTLKKKLHTFGVPLLAALIFACKPMPASVDTQSEVKTVDNFAAGERKKTQVCGPSKPNNISELADLVSGPNEKLRFAAIQSLAAVPEKLSGAIFGEKFKGRIKIVSAEEISRQCRPAEAQFGFENESASGLDFCWKRLPGMPLLMWVRADEKIIRHGILRLVSYVYLQLIEDHLSDRSGSSTVGSEIALQMRSARSKLSSQFISDVARNTQFSARTASLQQARKTNPADFDRKLFAEMMDSVYCNAATQTEFQTGFPSSFAEFVGKGGNGSINFTAIFGRPWHAR